MSEDVEYPDKYKPGDYVKLVELLSQIYETNERNTPR